MTLRTLKLFCAHAFAVAVLMSSGCSDSSTQSHGNQQIDLNTVPIIEAKDAGITWISQSKTTGTLQIDIQQQLNQKASVLLLNSLGAKIDIPSAQFVLPKSTSFIFNRHGANYPSPVYLSIDSTVYKIEHSN